MVYLQSFKCSIDIVGHVLEMQVPLLVLDIYFKASVLVLYHLSHSTELNIICLIVILSRWARQPLANACIITDTVGIWLEAFKRRR